MGPSNNISGDKSAKLLDYKAANANMAGFRDSGSDVEEPDDLLVKKKSNNHAAYIDSVRINLMEYTIVGLWNGDDILIL